MRTLLLIVALGIALPAWAGESPYVDQVRQRSLSMKLLGQPGLLLVRQPRRGVQETERRVVKALNLTRQPTLLIPANAKRLGNPGTHVLLNGPRSSLEIREGGAQVTFEYRGLRPSRKTQQLGRGVLKRAGARFIKQTLQSLVPLAADEKLAYLGEQVERFETFDATTRASQRFVLFTTASFGVEKQGHPIIGNEITVSFRRPNEVVGFSVRHDKFSISATRQQLVSKGELRQRSRAAALEPASPLVNNFVCGFLNTPGAAKTVQLGCLIAYRTSMTPGALGQVRLIPLARKPLPDPAIPMTLYLKQRGEPGRARYQHFLQQLR